MHMAQSGDLLCALITYHGTVVRWSEATRSLVHCTIAGMDEDGAQTVVIPRSEHDRTVSLPDGRMLGVDIVPQTRRAHFRADGHFLCADPAIETILSDRSSPNAWETFLLLPVAELTQLRRVLTRFWTQADAPGSQEADSELWAGAWEPPFTVRIGGVTIDLSSGSWRLQGGLDGQPGSLSVLPADPGGPPVTFIDAGSNQRAEIALRPAPLGLRVGPAAADVDAFRSGRFCSLAADGQVDLMTSPLFATRSDASILFRRFWHGASPWLGDQRPCSRFCRASNKYVLLDRYFEGILFDEAGTYSEAGYLGERRAFYPAGVRRDFETLRIEHSVLPSAQRLSGPYVVSFNPHLSNYYHWLVESVLPLHMIRNVLPAGTRILMPATLAGFRDSGSAGFDHRRILSLLGLDDLPIDEIDASICHLEDAIWIEGYGIQHVPGTALRAFRDSAEARLGTPTHRQERIHISRRGARSVANEAELKAFLAVRGFQTYFLEDMSDEQQIALFQRAEFVVATHGAALANLLFCHPGTKVIELTPDTEFRPFFWTISEKLGLCHAVLPCEAAGNNFNGNLGVPMDRFEALFRMTEIAPPASQRGATM